MTHPGAVGACGGVVILTQQMIGPISRPLAPAYLKGIHVPTPIETKPQKAEPNPEDKAEAAQQDQDQQISELKRRDAEVRAHEQAHLAAAGQYARGGATFEFEIGPDGKRYAVGGEVGIDVSEAATPEQTVTKANIVRRAALAPAQPSAQDRKVAAMASAMESAAKAEIADEKQEDSTEDKPKASALGQAEAGDASPGELLGADLIAGRAAAIAGARAYGRGESALVSNLERTPSRSIDPPRPRSQSGQPKGSVASLDMKL